MFFLIVGVIIQLIIGSIISPIPLRDNDQKSYGAFPWMTISIITVNVLVYVLWQAPDYMDALRASQLGQQAMFDAALERYAAKVNTYGAMRSHLMGVEGIGAFSTFTSTFMHGDFGHLMGNMIFLWAFGQRIEDACGPWRYLMFYLFTGMAAVTGDYVLLSSDFPSVGASGAVFGLMGAYLILFPGQRIRCLWFGMAFFRSIGISIIRVFGVKRFRRSLLVPIPAFVLMLLYGLSDLVLTFESAQTGELVGRVNYVAHAFGFVSACTILLFVRKDLLTRYLAGRKL